MYFKDDTSTNDEKKKLHEVEEDDEFEDEVEMKFHCHFLYHC